MDRSKLGALTQLARRISNPIRAYHGTPHKFDEFDISKIGTGEGQQAYGHGLYFAEHEPVAKHYRDQLSPGNAMISLSPRDEAQDLILRQFKDLAEDGHSYTIDDLKSFVRGSGSYSEPEMMEAFYRLAERAKEKNPGHMYEVNLHVPRESLLNWDAPIASQPNIFREIVNDYFPTEDWAKPEYVTRSGRHISGGDAYFNIAGKIGKSGSKHYGSPAAVKDTSRLLLDAGIPGIQYLDEGSRFASDGTRNLVMFDDKPIEIVRRYAHGGALNMMKGR